MSVAINESTGVDKEKYNEEFGTTDEVDRFGQTHTTQTYWSVDCVYCSS